MAAAKVSFGNTTNIERTELILNDCTPSRRIALQNEVNTNCKGQRSKCLVEDTCPILTDKMTRINKCIQARTKINTTCFKGGDIGHNQAITQSLNSLIRCQAYAAQKCMQPKNVPSIEPIPIPNPDEDFMEKMERITGLAGAALIIYLIISEGSRLFPPRNLIPIP